MRLVKYLAHAGVASRRASETLIAAGRVSVEGEVVTDPARDVNEQSRVALDGQPLAGPEPHVLYALNKPVGVVSTARDTHGRKTVVELVDTDPTHPRLYPVGRLDVNSSGLMLLTNDGELANRLTHPRFEVPKTYRVRLAGAPIGDGALRALRAGVQPAGRPDRACPCVSRGRAGIGSDRADDPRGTQSPGAPDVRGGRPPSRGVAARRLRAPAS